MSYAKCFFIYIAIFLTFGLYCARAARLNEYQIKVAYIYNFIKFVKWPSDNSSDTIAIYVYKYEKFKKYIQCLDGKKVENKIVVVKDIDNIAQIMPNSLLIVGNINNDDIKYFFLSLSKKHILTISDVDSFIEVGGIVQFVTVGRKIKFKINNKSAQKAGIKISSKLLRLAIKVVR